MKVSNNPYSDKVDAYKTRHAAWQIGYVAFCQDMADDPSVLKDLLTARTREAFHDGYWSAQADFREIVGELIEDDVVDSLDT